MKYLFLTVAAVLFFCQGLSAQADAGFYLKVTYYEASAGVLISHHSNDVRGIQQQRVDSGEIAAWRFYKVLYSSNAAHRYQFVTVEIADQLNGLQTPPSDRTNLFIEGAHENILIASKVHSEIWRTRAGVYRTGLVSPSRYKNANFMRATPGRLEEYLDLEINIAAPLHQNQADNGRMDGWNFNRLIFPTGTAVAYNFITTDFYSELEQIEMGITRELITRVHPDLDVDEFEDFADSIRTRVWSDLWELLDHVE